MSRLDLKLQIHIADFFVSLFFLHAVSFFLCSWRSLFLNFQPINLATSSSIFLVKLIDFVFCKPYLYNRQQKSRPPKETAIVRRK